MNHQGFEIENGVLSRYKGKGSSLKIPKNLISIRIPEGVKAVGKGAFSRCNGIGSVIIPDGTKTIGDDAFYGCKSLKSVAVPDSVRKIGNRAFAECPNLTRARIPETAAFIGYAVFSDSPLTESYPDGFVIHHHCLLEYIRDEETVIIPETVTKIRSLAFVWLSVKHIVVPDSVQKMNMDAVSGCRNLHSITAYHMTLNVKNREIVWNSDFELLCSVRDFLKNPEQQKIMTYLIQNRKRIFCLDMKTFRNVLETGKIFTENIIDNYIRYAIENQYYEKQILLTEYKYQHFGFKEIGEKFKL